MPYSLKWGIVGAGGISAKFAEDLALSTASRNVTDVAHAIIAVGSRSKEKAELFIANNCPEGGCAQKEGYVNSKPEARGSYAEVYNHPDVDIVYIGTPHTKHYEDTKNALEAGKHVLVEKPATLNRNEFASLVQLAQSKRKFLMEGVWTRFFPLAYKVQSLLFEERAIGDIRRIISDFSMNFNDNVPDTHRIRAPHLAGGGLLDLGPYPLVWAMMSLYHHPMNELTPPSKITASMTLDEKSGIDLFTDFTLDFPKVGAKASLHTSIVVNGAAESVTRIQGSMGEIALDWAPSRPEHIKLRRTPIGRGPQKFTEEIYEFPLIGEGLWYEADAVARDIRDGKTENERMPLKESLLTMEIFDEIRRQGGYVYASGLEKVTA